ncbi:MAG: Nramp family divalent metal transporter [bacterium]|nr:Nramp family divalent metal transporter [bacterium]
MQTWKRHRYRFLIFLAILGPGIITANVDNDAGGIATYSVCGANFGYTLLWTLIPVTIALVVVQEMCTRMGVVTGKGLADLIRENFGFRTTFWVMVALVLTNFGNIVANFAGVAASLEIFGISKYISVPLSALFVWWLVVRGTYRTVEKVFLIACLFYITYLISGFLARPPWEQVLHQTIVPQIQFDSRYLIMVIAIVGTTITPWMQFYIQSSVVEKGVKIERYRYTKWDVITGCIITDVVAAFIIISCAATLYVHGIKIETAEQAALALGPLAGEYATTLFAFGLFNASLFAASILPLSTAYSVCEGMGWESGVDKRFREAPKFYGLYTALIVFGAGIILIPNIPLLFIMVLSQFINGILLPFILIYMLLLVNDKGLMGKYVNGKAFNLIAWITSIGMIILTVILVVVTIIEFF